MVFLLISDKARPKCRCHLISLSIGLIFFLEIAVHCRCDDTGFQIHFLFQIWLKKVELSESDESGVGIFVNSNRYLVKHHWRSGSGVHR